MNQPLRLSPKMQEALDTLREHGSLICCAGGFWTYMHCEPLPNRGVLVHTRHGLQRQRVPSWYVSTNTVQALVSRGLAEYQYAEKVVPTERTP